MTSLTESVMKMDHSYARSKLTVLLRDLDRYTGEEFWRQLSRIAAGSTGAIHAEGLKQQHDALCAFVNEALDSSFEGCDLDGAWIQERCHQLNLVDYVPYDPDQHHVDCDVVEPGDMIYVRTSWLGIKSAEGTDG